MQRIMDLKRKQSIKQIIDYLFSTKLSDKKTKLMD